MKKLIILLLITTGLFAQSESGGYYIPSKWKLSGTTISPSLSTWSVGLPITTATSLALGGATISTHALAVAGTSLFGDLITSTATRVQVGDGTNRNVGVGLSTMPNLTTGTDNSAFGWNPLDNLVGGSRNSAFGRHALSYNVSGNDNTAFGSDAMGYGQGSSNTAIGSGAGHSRATMDGSYNTYVGFEAGKNIDVGSNNNVFVGALAGQSFAAYRVMSDNVIIGTNAMQQLGANTWRNQIIGSGAGLVLTGHSNTFIGYAAGATTTTGSGNIIIGSGVQTNLTSATTDNELRIGNYLVGDLTNGNLTLGAVANTGTGTLYAGTLSSASLATSAAIPLLLTNGQLVNISLTSQTVGATTLTIPDFAGVVDEFTFKTKAQTLSNKTFVTPVLGVATATSLALGGAVIGTNALAVTGTSLFGPVTSNSTSGFKNVGATQANLFLENSAGSVNEKVSQLLNISGNTYIRSLSDDYGSVIKTILTLNHTTGNVGIGQTTFLRSAKLGVTGMIMSSDTLWVGNNVTYSYITPGGALVQSSDESLKNNITLFQPNLANFSKIKPRKYNFKEENFYRSFDEKSVPDSVEKKIDNPNFGKVQIASVDGKDVEQKEDSLITIKVDNSEEKLKARVKFRDENLKEAAEKAKINYTGFFANEFNEQMLGRTSVPNKKAELNSNEVIAVMWLKIQENEKEINLLRERIEVLEAK